MARQAEVDRLSRELAEAKLIRDHAIAVLNRTVDERDALLVTLREVPKPVPVPPAVDEWMNGPGKLIPMPDPTFVAPSALEELAQAVLDGRVRVDAADSEGSHWIFVDGPAAARRG